MEMGLIPAESWAIFLDPRSDVIVVEGPSDDALRDLLRDYGNKVEFRRVVSEPHLATRFKDTQPYYGGSSFSGSGSSCTLGFSVRFTSGVAAIVTAGHCWPMGYSPANSIGNHAGPVVSRENPTSNQPSHDTEVLSQKRYSGRIYVGLDAGAWKSVLGAGNPVVNANYCVSGAKTFEHCGLEADQVGISKFFSDDGVWVDDLTRTSPSRIDHGDSGGPFYLDAPNGVWARGTAVGFDEVANHDYFQLWSYIASRFAVTICTVYEC